mmetsp:Transcript_37046/g.75540  ORF Transcript_37046/g.75540 Transcript_37046/m.75540 type:complete len:363 (-) Transcript_37046:2162-3250(-)
MTSSTGLVSSIIDALRASDNGKSMNLKKLRSSVLTEEDKASKKQFKEAVKQLEKDERVSLSSDGELKLSKSERKSADDEPTEKKKKSKKEKKQKKEKKSKKRKDTASSDDEKESKKQKKQDETPEEDDDDVVEEANGDAENNNEEAEAQSDDPADKNKPCKNNPQGITRLFIGNLPFAITETTLNDFLNGSITHLKWITDKETGKFYGSAFAELRNSKDAAKCMQEINGTQLMGRPIKLNYAPPKDLEDWPPKSRVITGGKVANAGGQAGGKGIKAMSVKPEGCSKLFIGNLSYEIDDEGITKFFMTVDAEIKAVRWLFHQDSGDFKGVGYVDFWNTDACEKAATLNGKNLLGRPIRIDWAE